MKKLFNSRLFLMLSSAELTFGELFTITVNKIIFFSSQFYYHLKFLILGLDPKVFYGYRRHLPKDIKPKGYCLVAFLPEIIYKEHFIGRLKFFFSNNGTTLTLLQALNELGYVVDVIHFTNEEFVPKRHYDVFFFYSYKIYEALSPRLNPDVISILFEATAYWRPMLENIRQRLTYFEQRHGVKLLEKEYNYFLWLEQTQDQVERVYRDVNGVVVIGDQLAKSFQQSANPRIKYIKTGAMPDPNRIKDLSLANLERGRKNFLFFGGADVFRKGLDIILDAFLDSPYNIYFCIDYPPLFEQIYKISQQKNFHHFSYLKLGSRKFMQVINNCDFVIQLSAAEGVPGGVIEVMKYGLIPVVSKECNVPESQDCGYLLPLVTVEETKKAMEHVCNLPAEKLQSLARLAIQTIQTNYSPEAYTADLKRSISEIISGV